MTVAEAHAAAKAFTQVVPSSSCGPFAARYSRCWRPVRSCMRTTGIGLLRDLQDLYLLAAECDIAWTVVGQAAYGAREDELLAVVRRCEGETAIQLKWLRTRMKAAAPQALVVAD
ncbi:hypothetical protein [Micromonospora orduensis]|uniref:hypothetical protein n=1 Tax=Micromonospora orduensis TaxID=1420891 RepID=UPI0034112DE3